MNMVGTVKGTIHYADTDMEYVANVSGNYWEDKGDYWTPPSSDSEGPFYEDTDWVDYDEYETHREEIDAIIKNDVEENKEWGDCDWDWDNEPDYPDPPEREDD